MAETIEEAKRRITNTSKSLFRGKVLLTTEHLQYFRPLKTPLHLVVGNGKISETLEVNPYTNTLTIKGCLAISYYPTYINYKSNLEVSNTSPHYDLNCRIWTANNERFTGFVDESFNKFVSVNVKGENGRVIVPLKLPGKLSEFIKNNNINLTGTKLNLKEDLYNNTNNNSFLKEYSESIDNNDLELEITLASRDIVNRLSGESHPPLGSSSGYFSFENGKNTSSIVKDSFNNLYINTTLGIVDSLTFLNYELTFDLGNIDIVRFYNSLVNEDFWKELDIDDTLFSLTEKIDSLDDVVSKFKEDSVFKVSVYTTNDITEYTLTQVNNVTGEIVETNPVVLSEKVDESDYLTKRFEKTYVNNRGYKYFGIYYIQTLEDTNLRELDEVDYTYNTSNGSYFFHNVSDYLTRNKNYDNLDSLISNYYRNSLVVKNIDPNTDKDKSFIKPVDIKYNYSLASSVDDYKRLYGTFGYDSKFDQNNLISPNNSFRRSHLIKQTDDGKYYIDNYFLEHFESPYLFDLDRRLVTGNNNKIGFDLNLVYKGFDYSNNNNIVKTKTTNRSGKEVNSLDNGTTFDLGSLKTNFIEDNGVRVDKNEKGAYLIGTRLITNLSAYPDALEFINNETELSSTYNGELFTKDNFISGSGALSENDFNLNISEVYDAGSGGYFTRNTKVINIENNSDKEFTIKLKINYTGYYVPNGRLNDFISKSSRNYGDKIKLEDFSKVENILEERTEILRSSAETRFYRPVVNSTLNTYRSSFLVESINKRVEIILIPKTLEVTVEHKVFDYDNLPNKSITKVFDNLDNGFEILSQLYNNDWDE